MHLVTCLRERERERERERGRRKEESGGAGAVLGIFIWVGQSKAKQILGRPTGVVYVGIMGMTRAVWVGQERVWVGHGLPGLISRTDCVEEMMKAKLAPQLK